MREALYLIGIVLFILLSAQFVYVLCVPGRTEWSHYIQKPLDRHIDWKEVWKEKY